MHPWLPDTIVDRNPQVDGLPIGIGSAAADGDLAASVENPLEGTLASDVGHGTFIAGLIRQTCPDANILAVRIMHSDGIVSESDLLRALNRLLARQAIALSQHDATSVIDSVSLSLGYYHESPPDEVFDHVLLPTLDELAKRGVAVVTSAGNDATTRQMYPAAFTPNPAGPVVHPTPGEVPLVSVGALNPSGTSVALFSNSGGWVTTHRPGAAVISTMPVTLDASLQPTAATSVPRDGARADIDVDDFTGGFATWSGTSFAAPILAGEIAQFLFGTNELNTLTAADMVVRGCKAVETLTGLAAAASA
jgi:subtilisin family serine protease